MWHDAKQSGCFAPNQNKYDEALSEYKDRWSLPQLAETNTAKYFLMWP